MTQTVGLVLGLAYLCGLWATLIPGGQYLILGLGILIAITSTLWQQRRQIERRRYRRQQASKKPGKGQAVASESTLGPSLLDLPSSVWLIAGLVGLLAAFYLQIRTPQPAANDISQLILQGGKTQNALVTVRGEVTSTPRLTRSGRVQFWLRAIQVNEIAGNNQPIEVSQEVSGKVYVTVSPLQATGLYPNLLIAVT
ncbi:MAG: DUF4131 domain-containing protein, partial [Microcoleaceae cyanobacterium]